MMNRSTKIQFYILPSLFTTMNLLCGLYAIIASIDGLFVQAALAIFVGGFFDGVDGRVARFTGTTSRFGLEYDSLCDLVSFGVAPAIFVYNWVLQDLGRYGMLVVFFYVSATALRLARFNVQDTSAENGKQFTGLPCPAAGYMVGTGYFFVEFFQLGANLKSIAVLVFLNLLSYLMVSTHSYISLKQPANKAAKTFQALVCMVLLLLVLATEPRVTLFVIGVLYILSGPFGGLYRLCKAEKDCLAETDQCSNEG